MKRYVLYTNDSGVHFVDLVNDYLNSMSYFGACWDEYFIKDNCVYCKSDYIDEENSTFEDVCINSNIVFLGKVLYSTNDYSKIKDLIGLNIEERDLWKDFQQSIQNKKEGTNND